MASKKKMLEDEELSGDEKKDLEDMGATIATTGEEHRIGEDFVWREFLVSKRVVGVQAQFNGHGYICEQMDCLHRDPLGTGSEYMLKQGKWFETKFWKDGEWVEQIQQPTEVTNSSLAHDLTSVNEILRPLISV
jgi:hypothetical protein